MADKKNYVQKLLIKTADFLEVHMYTNSATARNFQGDERTPLAPDTCQWNIWGALLKVDATYKQVGSNRVLLAKNTIQAVLQGEHPCHWEKGKTQEQAVAVIREAARRD